MIVGPDFAKKKNEMPDPINVKVCRCVHRADPLLDVAEI
jgi:hypothetical protein